MEQYSIIIGLLGALVGALFAGAINTILLPAFYKEWVLRKKRLKPLLRFSNNGCTLEVRRLSKYSQSTQVIVNYFKFAQFPAVFFEAVFKSSRGDSICFYITDGKTFAKQMKRAFRQHQVVSIDRNVLYIEEEQSIVVSCCADIHIIPTSITTGSGHGTMRFTLTWRFIDGQQEFEIVLSYADYKGLKRFLRNRSTRHRNRYLERPKL